MTCLSDRCYKICSSYKIISDDFEQFKTLLARNGYLKYVLEKCVRREDIFLLDLQSNFCFMKEKDPKQTRLKRILFVCRFWGGFLLQI